jgi:adenylate cyclase
MQQAYLPTPDGMAEAIKLALDALELDPRFGLAAALAGLCYMNSVLWGYATDPLHDRMEAIRLTRLALSADDGDPDTLAFAAFNSAFTDEQESAIELANRAVTLNSNSYFAWHARGWACKAEGLLEEAIQSFERAARLNPVDPRLSRSHMGMAMALIELRRFDEAIVAGKKVIRQHPSFAPGYRCAASALAHLGRDDEAREAAAHLLEVEPTFTISSWIARGGQTNAKGKLFIEGLRKAGLPE